MEGIKKKDVKERKRQIENVLAKLEEWRVHQMNSFISWLSAAKRMAKARQQFMELLSDSDLFIIL